MKCIELFNELKSMAVIPVDENQTCDTFKNGNPEEEIVKVATSMFATPDVIRDAAEWGANLLIVHEPIYYNHTDNERYFPTAKEKEKLIAENKITIFRFHDYAHSFEPDLICEGELTYLNLPGQFKKGKYLATNNYILDDEISAIELAEIIKKNLGLKTVRIAGNPNAIGRKISCSFGTPGHLEESLMENNFVLTGEIFEWGIGEMARDYAQFGYNKAIIVMGHIGSERCGMMMLAERINELHPEFETKYFECGEVYSYV